MDDGYIKFNLDWKKSSINFDISEINTCREKLYGLGLIGAYPSGIGYGNISIRIGKNNEFIITGSETGNKKKLNIDDYSLVTSFDVDKNFVSCIGLTKASSESMTHAAIYEANLRINAVIHIHSKRLWDFLKNKTMCISKDIPYGTPEMAHAVGKLAKENASGIIVMLGHVEGIISYGKNIDDALKKIIKN
ncbi:MAG: class II aldolase/adducin family protein [archaeon]